jgi:hypothetical protein
MDAREIAEGLSEKGREHLAYIAVCYEQDDLGKLPVICPRELFDTGLVEAYPVSSKDERTVRAKFTLTDLGRQVASLLQEQADE